MTNEELLSVAEIVERATNRIHRQAADHEAKMVEHRAAFGVRTEADAKIIAGLRQERDGLLTQVQDMRAEMERLREERDQFRNSLGDMLEGEGLQRVVREWDALRAEVAELKTQLERLKSPTSKHPVKVGEWVERISDAPWGALTERAQVVSVSDTKEDYRVRRSTVVLSVWDVANCTPCDPPATHDTEAGKAAAELALTEPVADEIKVGDLVEVFQATAVCTKQDDIGARGKVEYVEKECVGLFPVNGFKTAAVNHVGRNDVRKVTT